MAAAFTNALSRGAVEVRSAGTQPAAKLNPTVVAAMAEVGIDLGGVTPRLLTEDDARSSDVVITMGCGDTCPFFPGVAHLDWVLDDPAGRPLDVVRSIRDAIECRVRDLLHQLGVDAGLDLHRQ